MNLSVRGLSLPLTFIPPCALLTYVRTVTKDEVSGVLVMWLSPLMVSLSHT